MTKTSGSFSDVIPSLKPSWRGGKAGAESATCRDMSARSRQWFFAVIWSGRRNHGARMRWSQEKGWEDKRSLDWRAQQAHEVSVSVLAHFFSCRRVVCKLRWVPPLCFLSFYWKVNAQRVSISASRLRHEYYSLNQEERLKDTWVKNGLSGLKF